VYHSVKPAGSGVTQHFRAEFKGLNASNAMGHTNQNTTKNLDGAARLTPRSTHQDWKQKKGNHAPTHSSVQTVTETIKQTPTNIHFGVTGSIGNGIRRSTLRSVRTDPNRSALK